MWVWSVFYASLTVPILGFSRSTPDGGNNSINLGRIKSDTHQLRELKALLYVLQYLASFGPKVQLCR